MCIIYIIYIVCTYIIYVSGYSKIYNQVNENRQKFCLNTCVYTNFNRL